MKNQILRLPAVKAQTGLSRSTIYLRIKQGAFPAPVALGPRAVGWNSEDIDCWIDDCINSERDKRAHRDLKDPSNRGGSL